MVQWFHWAKRDGRWKKNKGMTRPEYLSQHRTAIDSQFKSNRDWSWIRSTRNERCGTRHGSMVPLEEKETERRTDIDRRVWVRPRPGRSPGRCGRNTGTCPCPRGGRRRCAARRRRGSAARRLWSSRGSWSDCPRRGTSASPDGRSPPSAPAVRCWPTGALHATHQRINWWPLSEQLSSITISIPLRVPVLWCAWLGSCPCW